MCVRVRCFRVTISISIMMIIVIMSSSINMSIRRMLLYHYVYC